MFESRPNEQPRRLRSAATLTACSLLGVSLLSGCGSGWWLPVSSEEPAPVASVFEPDTSSSFSADLGVLTTLGVVIDDIPSAWNAVAEQNGSGFVLPDPIVADDTSDGLATATISTGDGTVTLQWTVESGEVTLVEVNGPVDGDVTTSAIAGAAEALAAATLDLDDSDAVEFMAELIKSGVESSVDGSFISQFAQSGNANVAFDVSDGAATVAVTPSG